MTFNKDRAVRNSALSFIVLMGVVSMFSDMTHEGAWSILGDYLSLAGASAAAIGFVSGFGEMVGYSLRLLTGYLVDKTKRYWPLTIIGYIIDCMAIPALALVPEGGWIWACMLIVVQRMAKAVKKPAKDTLLSFAATRNGVGKSFALQEFLDQIGAFLGPVILFLVVLIDKGGSQYATYSLCFAILGIPAIVTIVLLLVAWRRFPNPEDFEPEPKDGASAGHLRGSFRVYNVAACLFAFGFIDFTLITMHTSQTGIIPSDTLPLIYAGAMAVDAFSALFFGWLYDRKGFSVLMISTMASAPFALFVFMVQSPWSLFIGVALWGIGMGAQESILKAAVTTIVPKGKRGSALGIFQTAFGISWFLGSWLSGVLYEVSIPVMVLVSMLSQLAAVPFFNMTERRFEQESAADSAGSNDAEGE